MAEPASRSDSKDTGNLVTPNLLELYNEFYDQQMLIYDPVWCMPEDLTLMNPSDYHVCYPVADQTKLYPEQALINAGTKKNPKWIIKPNHCQHPKHPIYAALVNAAQSTVVPRRGRPPKGSKPTDITETAQLKRLPKRLEPVVGIQDAHVCLTCLRRSDDDFEYHMNPDYVPPTCGGRAGRSKSAQPSL
ncbi:hypothetical protein BC943DRAFT_364302 [Umbelopsis sp. AD052]|nr:hypothetical protein BC943DRAFT_364302 [Umbelopsis sp. AD052]